MWELLNDTPFQAERTLACDKNGSDVWLVAVKGTFHIKPDGKTEIADHQEEVLQALKHRGDANSTSLLYESDLDYTKPTTDIILHGHAYAPKEKPATKVDVKMIIGVKAKTLQVFGDRYWRNSILGIKMTHPKPFVKMPITYERAYGGVDQLSENPNKHGWEPRNPVGTGFVVKPKHLVNHRAPNIEDPKALISSWRARPQPAGFGPIARHWSPRVKYAGTYDEHWEKERLPLLPEDFSERFFQCAPADQQPKNYLKGNELVELYNLTLHGFMRFYLPGIVLGFSTKVSGETVCNRGNLHSVILEPDVPRVMMVWHMMLPCHGEKYALESTSIFQKKVH